CRLSILSGRLCVVTPGPAGSRLARSSYDSGAKSESGKIRECEVKSSVGVNSITRSPESGAGPDLSGETRSLRCAVRCAGLIKRYADVTAVDGLNLEVELGECFGLLGPNGAGKTTTIEILEGLTPADGGSLEVLGQTWGAGDDHALRQRLGVQLQETQLADKLTVEETIRLFRSFYARGRDVDQVIETVALEEKRRARVGKLSGGQKQRLAVACSLVSDPDLLFLDEPTTGLDPQARLKLWEIVEGFRAEGGTI